MTYNLIFELPCTYAGEIETINAKNGKTYAIRKCGFSDGLREIKGAVFFANKDGFLPKLKVGDTYRIQMTKFYDRESKTAKEFFKLLSCDDCTCEKLHSETEAEYEKLHSEKNFRTTNVHRKGIVEDILEILRKL